MVPSIQGKKTGILVCNVLSGPQICLDYLTWKHSYRFGYETA